MTMTDSNHNQKENENGDEDDDGDEYQSMMPVIMNTMMLMIQMKRQLSKQG